VSVASRRRKEKIDGPGLLAFQIKAAKLPEPKREYRFHGERLWRSDFCWPGHLLIVEFEGGVYTHGAHVRGKHFESDCEKYNAAALMGYRVLRFTIDMVTSGAALQTIEKAIGPARML
jgi:very-short-patch-repair endonuclease